MKHKKKDDKYNPHNDVDKRPCDGCGKLQQEWRLERCPVCGKKFCPICWSKHWHNEE